MRVGKATRRRWGGTFAVLGLTALAVSAAVVSASAPLGASSAANGPRPGTVVRVPMVAADDQVQAPASCGIEAVRAIAGAPTVVNADLTTLGLRIENPCPTAFANVKLVARLTAGGASAGEVLFFAGRVEAGSVRGSVLVLPGIPADAALQDVRLSGVAVGTAPPWKLLQDEQGIRVASVTGLAPAPAVSMVCTVLGAVTDVWHVAVNGGNGLTALDAARLVLAAPEVETSRARCEGGLSLEATAAGPAAPGIPAGTVAVLVNEAASLWVSGTMYTPGAYYNTTGKPARIDTLTATVRDNISGKLMERVMPVETTDAIAAGGSKPVLLALPAVEGTVVAATATWHAVTDAGWLTGGPVTIYIPASGTRITMGAALAGPRPSAVEVAGYDANSAATFVAGSTMASMVQGGQYAYLTYFGVPGVSDLRETVRRWAAGAVIVQLTWRR